MFCEIDRNAFSSVVFEHVHYEPTNALHPELLVHWDQNLTTDKANVSDNLPGLFVPLTVSEYPF